MNLLERISRARIIVPVLFLIILIGLLMLRRMRSPGHHDEGAAGEIDAQQCDTADDDKDGDSQEYLQMKPAGNTGVMLDATDSTVIQSYTDCHVPRDYPGSWQHTDRYQADQRAVAADTRTKLTVNPLFHQYQ